MQPEQIQPGLSYACKYNTLLGVKLAVIVQRDTHNQRLRIRDVEDGHDVIVNWHAVWDIDTVEWINE